MSVILGLDANTLGLVTNPNKLDEAEKCRAWLATSLEQGAIVAVPETAYKEVMQGLRYAKDRTGEEKLNAFIADPAVVFVETRSETLAKAREFHDYAHKAGYPPGPPGETNADCKVAAEAVLAWKQIGLPESTRVVVASDNFKHIGIFVEAYKWKDINVAELSASKDQWQPPALREETQPKEGKIILDQSRIKIDLATAREGFPRHEVVPTDYMGLKGPLSGSQLVEAAQTAKAVAVITDNQNAVAEARESFDRSKGRVVVQTIDPEVARDRDKLKAAMPGIAEQLQENLSQSLVQSRSR